MPILGNSRGDTKRGRGDVKNVPSSPAFLDAFIVLQKWIPCYCTTCIPCYYTVHIIRLREADSLPYGFYRWAGALFNEDEETTEPSPVFLSKINANYFYCCSILFNRVINTGCTVIYSHYNTFFITVRIIGLFDIEILIFAAI